MGKSVFLMVTILLFVFGLFIIFSSVSWGSGSANAYLLSHGGGMDSTQFAVVLQESINMYRWIGGILAALGGLGFVKTIEPR